MYIWYCFNVDFTVNLLDTNELLQGWCRVGLGAFDGQTKSTIPDQRGQHTEGTRNTEHDCVVVHFLQVVVLQEDTGVSIYIWPGVLDLAELGENWWHDLVDGGHEMEQGIVGQVLEGELALAFVTWIGFAENSVTVAGNNLARFQCLPDEVLELIFGDVLADFLLQF